MTIRRDNGSLRRQDARGAQDSASRTEDALQSYDHNSNIVYRPDGRPRHEPCIDPETHKYRVLMYELFSKKHWPPYKIARQFNHLKVDGWDGWTARGPRAAVSDNPRLSRTRLQPLVCTKV